MKTLPTLALLMPLSLLTAATTVPDPIAVAPFDAIKLQAGDDIELVHGPTRVVVTRADAQTLAALSVETVDGVLRIGRKPDACQMPHVCQGNAAITVSTPSLSRIVIQGSGNIHGRDLGSRNVAVVMQGSGNVRIDGLQTQLAAVEMDGSGVIRLGGHTERLSVSANGGGSLDTTALAARDADVTMNGGGSVRARATGTATIGANGGGSIRVEGARECHITRAGHADISCPKAA